MYVHDTRQSEADAFMPPAQFGRGRRNGIDRRLALLLKDVFLNIREDVPSLCSHQVEQHFVPGGPIAT
jgi:hypothetical protein